MVRKEATRLVAALFRANQGGLNASWSVGGTRLKSAMPQPSETKDEDLHAKDGKVLHPHLLNENVVKTQYAVRGELYLRAEQLRKEGKEIIFTNVGNPHALGAKPLTFPRQRGAPAVGGWEGTTGECGLRGGYVEMTNIHPGAVEEVYKCASINLSPNTMGQIALSCLVNPPKPGDPSYELYTKEKASELVSLRRRAHMVTDGFNALEGVTCNFTEGAMYSFPQIKLPAKAIAAAAAAGKAADVFYCLKLLEATGISTVPGSGFGQEDGTFHLRTTILPREEVMTHFVQKFEEFHKGFMKTYAA
ncbi:Glutamate--glyoxylate aminotransferase 2 [Tetrabaena socialis]|uniref:Glutamate--glyoxylate aminotransferase 2 n=1 Tax=Tetrabaena socialis TaxID=47790 RepID=A0A2J8A424_9CHLO|nr:Glutamate--glyoxylate aminotransferase 2 [Tetrabaena socialis]|eukprot:PNH07271.1 Glutamate--glyoxylate aminotransferase 2 [Tetrabaena socialis]